MASNGVTNKLWPNYSQENVTKTNQSGKKELGKDQFLSILITQLQNQDPLNPMEDKDFIAQMAQFTSLEQLMNISSQLTAMNQSLGAASNLIDKKVGWIEDSGDGSGSTVLKNGMVDSIIIRDGVQYAKIGDQEIDLKTIIQIESGAGNGVTP